MGRGLLGGLADGFGSLSNLFSGCLVSALLAGLCLLALAALL